MNEAAVVAQQKVRYESFSMYSGTINSQLMENRIETKPVMVRYKHVFSVDSSAFNMSSAVIFKAFHCLRKILLSVVMRSVTLVENSMK